MLSIVQTDHEGYSSHDGYGCRMMENRNWRMTITPDRGVQWGSGI